MRSRSVRAQLLPDSGVERWNGVPIPYGLPLEELEARLQQPGAAAWTAILALARDPQERAIQILTRCVRFEDWRFRRIALEAISDHALALDASGLIRASLHDPSPYVVRTAIEAILRLELTAAHDDLLSLFSANEAATRQAAVRGLSSMWGSGDFMAVLRLFRSDPSPAVRNSAAWTLNETAEASTWRTLFDTWKDDDLPRARTWACQLAGRYGNPDLVPELERLARDRNGHVRKAAARAMEQVCHLPSTPTPS
jgi:HEAT repeat protein